MKQRGNWMDFYFPKWGTMGRFWSILPIFAAIGGALLWYSDSADTFNDADQSNYMVRWWAFLLLWVFQIAALAVAYWAFNSENKKFAGTDGVGSTSVKQGSVMAWIFGCGTLCFSIVYTILSIKHLP